MRPCFAKSRSPDLTGLGTGRGCLLMWSTLLALLRSVCSALKSRRHLALENLALRQQLALLRKRSKRPQFGRVARIFMGLAFAALVGLARCLVLGSARDRHPLA